MRPWQLIAPAEDREVYGNGGYGGRQPAGKSPALLIIDVLESFTGTQPTNVLSAQGEYRTSCGEVAWEALPQIKELLEAFRRADLPVIYTRGDADYKYWCGGSTKPSRAAKNPQKDTTPIHPMIAPLEDEFVLRKTKASAFFLTPLTLYLSELGVDSLFVCGTSTSGCVRASVIDAFSHGYRVFVVEQGCFDRSQFSHLVNLFEMNNKYADVIQLTEALEIVGTTERAAGR